MSIAATLANNRGLDKAMTKAIPLAYASLSRHLLTNPAYGSRSISTTISQPRLMPNQSPSVFKQPYSPISPFFAASRNVSRHFSTDRHLDPYERFMRRTAINWGIKFVPQEEAFVVERFGKFHKVLEAGLHVLVPLVDNISYVHSLKEQTVEIPEQPAVTTDNVSIRVNGVLFVKVIDAERASYGNDNVMYAVIQLAQTVMRSAIGKMPLDKTFMERDTLNANIVEAINDVASQWGLICNRYEIRDIIPPPGIRDSMVMQAAAERRKRAGIIEAEGKRQAQILTSEAAKTDSINRAAGEGEAMQIMGKIIQEPAGQAAIRFKAAQAYVESFNNMANKSKITLIPVALGDSSSMVASSLSIYKNYGLDKHGNNAFQETPTVVVSPTQIEQIGPEVNDEKPVFSLQSPKKN
ncbi:uncharacterized protein LOC141606870 [Silene latifolia]|uniref:uncharacterized protein LOC141606870 n=1 Tax=Silene latifolia TaxID=37657 RepID=UPI003D77C1BB